MLDFDTEEAHESYAHQCGDYECDTDATERGGNVGVLGYALAHCCHGSDGQQPADTPAAACTYSCPYRAEVALLHEERAAEDGAVYRDKRQEDTERGIKRRSIFLHYHLHELCHRRDNGDKHYQREEAEVNLGEVGAEPRQGSGTEHVGLKQVVDGQGDIATDTIDRIHTTATSHSRVFIVEVMGHKVGWVTLHAGVAGGADIVLLPEIPYDIDVIAEAINRRKAAGKKFTIIAVAEGAISKQDAKLSKKDLKKKKEKEKYPSVAYELAEKVQKKTDQEVRITVPGHTQRGGSPCPYDRVLSTRLGAAAAEAILDGEFGCMIGVKKNEMVRVPLSEVAGKLKYVDPKASIIKEAELTGISFGV